VSAPGRKVLVTQLYFATDPRRRLPEQLQSRGGSSGGAPTRLRAGTMIRSASPGIASTADVAFTASGAARMAAARGTEITVQELG
jgi:hypothetical protein